ncbi:DUF3060 domain-containing protein [Mycobacterium sp. 21AC1]|uniref:DUF3060 domain-containing protein n=1 Tax=[Mycobacterium] appelbergii TaxID=2939269 RepID=UPI002938ED51|nr:DUF3060 domain-containing protein [Mycobacterium sp. 21AC1]MDV3124153.1 DUF3060 domain-containing protein [Mycobacterium sp. 21AC1]
MDPQDDPEARIGELEHQLSKRASELGTDEFTGHTAAPTQPWTYGNAFPPPPPPPTQPWPSYGGPVPVTQPTHSGSGGRILLVLAAVTACLVAGGISAYLMLSTSDRETSDAGGVFADEPPSPPSRTLPTATALPPVIASETAASAAPGETIVVTGINEHRTIECAENTVTVSGIENTLTITGHCINVAVSGIGHNITVDSVEAIVVSGIENQVTFHTGQPEIANSGQSNVIEQG